MRYSTNTFISGAVQSIEWQTLSGFIYFIIIVDFTRRVIAFIYSKQRNLPLASRDNFKFGINNIAKFIIGVGLVITLFGLFGIDLKSLLTSLSIVAAALAVITREYINDFFIGLYFSFSRDIEINDYIQVGNYKGKVIGIQMLKIKILNDDDDLVIVPNSKIYNNEIINFTKRDIRSLSIDFQVDIKVIESIENFEAELIKSLANFSDYLETNSFNLKIVQMNKDAIDFKFQYTLKNLDRNLQKKIRRKTVRQVFNYISETITH